MADFNIAWEITAVNEGADGTHANDPAGTTKWGITLDFLQGTMIKEKGATVDTITSMTKDKAGEYVKKGINDFLLNGADKYINDQHLYNMILDFAFNKPSFILECLGEALNRTKDVKSAIQRLKVPILWLEILRDISDPDIRKRQAGMKKYRLSVQLVYQRVYNWWWKFVINGRGRTVFLTAAPGLAMRVWRYKDYGTIGNREQFDAVKKAYEQTSNDRVRSHLNAYIKKMQRKGLTSFTNFASNDKEDDNTMLVLFGLGALFLLSRK